MRRHKFVRTTNKINGKAADMWVRGEWQPNGAGMIRHKVSAASGDHAVVQPPVVAMASGALEPPPY